MTDSQLPEHATVSPLVRVKTVARSLLKDKRVRGILQVVLSLALLAWLTNRVGLDVIASTLSGISWSWYIPAFLLFLANVVLRAYRWYILLAALDRDVSYGRLLYLYFVGFFFNNFIPSGFGGDVVKVISLQQDQTRGAEALSSVVMDRLVGLIGSASLALIALIWNGIQLWTGHTSSNVADALPPTLLLITALISLGVPAGFLLVRQVNPLKLLARYLPFTQRITEHAGLRRLVQTIRGYSLSALLQSLLISLPFTLGLVAIQYSIARALSVDVPFYLFPLFVPIIAIINALPLSFNGLGMREGVYQFLFVPVGVSSASAIAMSLAFYFLRVSAGLIGGLLYALKSAREFVRAP